jgi:hypothetical protein
VDVCPQKAGNRRFLNRRSRAGRKHGGGQPLIIVLLGLATASGTAMIISVKLACGGAELLTIRPMRIAMGATVFLIGVLTGAGIAAWMMPPV